MQETDTTKQSKPILTGVIVYVWILKSIFLAVNVSNLENFNVKTTLVSSLLCRFTSTPDKVSNKYYLGPAPMEEMAMQIATATGPCGNNREYLFKLEKAMHDIGEKEPFSINLY